MLLSAIFPRGMARELFQIFKNIPHNISDNLLTSSLELIVYTLRYPLSLTSYCFRTVCPTINYFTLNYYIGCLQIMFKILYAVSLVTDCLNFVFRCQVCGKGFRLNSTRLAHEKRHSGVRPHICDTCGRSFSMPDHLRRHLKTHEDKLDRLVPCPFCKKKIFSGRNMRKHLVRHRELNLTEEQAKAIASSLKPDRGMNEREAIDDDQRSHASTRSVRQMIRCIECDEEVKSVRKLFEHMVICIPILEK